MERVVLIFESVAAMANLEPALESACTGSAENRGIDVRATFNCTEIITCAMQTHNVLDEKGRRTREPASIKQQRFEFPRNSV